MKRRMTLMLTLLAVGVASAQTESLRIGPGDRLHVQMYDTPEMDQHPLVHHCSFLARCHWQDRQ
jgi:polysaccharide export outer membrane protein